MTYRDGERCRGYEGLTFDEVKQKLERPHRLALAHGANVREGKLKTAASAEDLMGVSYSVPLVRYMAHVIFENVEATLASTEGAGSLNRRSRGGDGNGDEGGGPGGG